MDGDAVCVIHGEHDSRVVCIQAVHIIKLIGQLSDIRTCIRQGDFLYIAAMLLDRHHPAFRRKAGCRTETVLMMMYICCIITDVEGHIEAPGWIAAPSTGPLCIAEQDIPLLIAYMMRMVYEFHPLHLKK